MLIPARSISLRAARILRPGVTGRLLASFERVCDLVTDAGEVVALVWGGIGDGPLNVVLAGDRGPGVIQPAGARLSVHGEGDKATILALASSAADSPVTIDLTSAVPWNPHPNWESLRARRPQVVAGAGLTASILAEAGWSPARCGLPEAVCEGATLGQAAALSALVGLGPGLTPAGDDWLAGWLLAQYLTEDLTGLRSRSMSGLVRKITADRTTTLSWAFLACAAAGEADAAWHALLSTLATDPMTNLLIYQSTKTILSHGATSGAAMLLGFCAGVGRLIPDP
jgi:hypothetical protein